MRSLGYDWTRSIIASIFNRNILDVFGVDKDAWIEMDSARAWMRAYQITLGLRTGIVSELYFAFGNAVYVYMICLGVIVSSIVTYVRKSRTEIGYIFSVSILSTVALAIMGQSTAVVGSIVTLVYGWLAINLLSVLANALAPKASVAGS
jgi:hypothetical protein